MLHPTVQRVFSTSEASCLHEPISNGLGFPALATCRQAWSTLRVIHVLGVCLTQQFDHGLHSLSVSLSEKRQLIGGDRRLLMAMPDTIIVVPRQAWTISNLQVPSRPTYGLCSGRNYSKPKIVAGNEHAP